MPHSVVTFPKFQAETQPVIDPKITSISPEMRSVHINVSPMVQKFVQYPTFLNVLTYSDVVANSSEKMEAVYERVTAFLQKIRDEDPIV